MCTMRILIAVGLSSSAFFLFIILVVRKQVAPKNMIVTGKLAPESLSFMRLK